MFFCVHCTSVLSLVGNMHVVINPELVMEVEARMNRAYLPSRLLPNLRGTSTLPHHRKSSLYHTSTGNRDFCTIVIVNFFYIVARHDQD